jgi:adenylate cyclase class IV
MPIEYEYVFRNYDKKKVIQDIIKLGGKRKGQWLFRIMIFNHPINILNTYIRVRDEGHRITMSYKYKETDAKFSDEYEINIDNFDTAVKILYGIGCTKKYYYEKIREIWNIQKTEIVFDLNPGSPERMEIESPTKKELDLITKKLDMTSYKDDRFNNVITMELFGFTISTNITDLTFNNVKKTLGHLVVKNKTIFNKIIRYQLKIFNKKFLR